MALDLSNLNEAICAMEKAIEAVETNAVPQQLTNVVRSGIIQHFEFTYELCWKYMKRWLENNGEKGNVDSISIKELFRIAAERGLIEDVHPWFIYNQKRNLTSHTYDRETADSVYTVALAFINDARAFLATIEKKND